MYIRSFILLLFCFTSSVGVARVSTCDGEHSAYRYLQERCDAGNRDYCNALAATRKDFEARGCEVPPPFPSTRKEVEKPSRDGLKYWQADPRPTDLEIPFETTKATINGNSTIDPALAARMCTISHRGYHFPGTQINGAEVSQMDFLAPVDVSSVSQAYQLPIASGNIFPVKIRLRLKIESYSNQRQQKDITLRGFLYKDSFGEWACRDAS